MDGRPAEDTALGLLTTSDGYHIAQTLKYLFLSEKTLSQPSYTPYSIRSWSGPILPDASSADRSSEPEPSALPDNEHPWYSNGFWVIDKT